jgi:hypothetical protein
MKKLLIGLMCMAAIAVSSFGQDTVHYTADGNMSDETWTTDDIAAIHTDATVQMDTNATWSIVRLGHSTGNGTLALTNDTLSAGKTLTVTDTLQIGHESAGAGNTGRLVQSTGTVSAVTTAVGGMANGVYDMSGGALTGTTLTIGHASQSGTGTMNQSGGTVSSTTVNVGGTGTSTYNLSGSGILSPATAINVGTTAGKAGTLTQSGGTASTAVLNVGTDGTYNLNGGTAIIGAGTSTQTLNGDLVINGGTLTLNKNDDVNPDNDDITINGSGTLTLQSGTLNSVGGAATEVTTFNADIAISGGTVDLGGQNRFTGEFKVIGDAASISIGRFSVSPDFVFEFTPGGTNLSTIVASYIALGSGSITVDGSNYGGGANDIILFDSSNITVTTAVYNVTGLGVEGVDWTLTQDRDTDLVTLSIIPEPAAIGLLGLGALVTLLISRYTRRS